MNSLPRVSTFGNMAFSLTSINVHNVGFLSPVIKSLSQLRTVWVQCRSKIQLTQELRRILGGQYDANFTKLETSHASQFSNHSLRSLLIRMGSCHIVIDTLGKSISQVSSISSWLLRLYFINMLNHNSHTEHLHINVLLLNNFTLHLKYRNPNQLDMAINGWWLSWSNYGKQANCLELC